MAERGPSARHIYTLHARAQPCKRVQWLDARGHRGTETTPRRQSTCDVHIGIFEHRSAGYFNAAGHTERRTRNGVNHDPR